MKKLLGILIVLALLTTPAFALDHFVYSGTDVLNDTTNQYETIGVWGDATLTIDYAETEPFGWNPHEAVSPFDTSTLIINDGIFDGYVGAPYNFGGYDVDGDGDLDGATGSNLIINGGTYNFRMGSSDGVMYTTINGGTFKNLYDSSTARIGGSTLTITGGEFYGSLLKNDLRISGGDMEVSGGTFYGGVRVDANQTTTISGGTWDGGRLYFINSDGNGETWVTGGDFTNMDKWGAYDYGDIHISGGQWSVASTWFDEMKNASNTYHFYGTGFTVTDLGSAPDGRTPAGTYYYKQVTGTLCDGNAFDMYGTFWDRYGNGNQVSFVFHDCPNGGDIPEPTTMALLGLGALGLVGARRRR